MPLKSKADKSENSLISAQSAKLKSGQFICYQTGQVYLLLTAYPMLFVCYTQPMHPLLNIALQGARSAGTQLLREFDRISSYQDDRQQDPQKIRNYLEQDFADLLKQKYPTHKVLFSQGESVKNITENETIWLVDLINGEQNYQRGIPHFAICIAIMQENKVEHALIYDPIMDEVFSATRSKQAQLNNFRLRIREKQSNNLVFIAGNRPITDLEQAIQTIQTGSNALMLAYTAAGRYDAFVGDQLTPIEAAIGSLLIKTAGGFSTDLQGGDSVLEKGEIVGANLKFLKVLLNQIG